MGLGSGPGALVGKRVANRYQVEASLYRDLLSEVYRATDTLEAEGQPVTLRALHPQLQRKPGFARHVLSWVAGLSAFEHGHVLATRDHGHEGGWIYVVSDASPERSLEDVLREDGPLPLERCLIFARQIAEALGSAHAAGLVHQQLTPARVLLGKVLGDQGVFLSGFGLAAPSEAIGTGVGALSIQDARYASPERAQDLPQEARSDLYSVGLILYEALSGELPFSGFFAKQLLDARVNQEAPPFAERAPGVVVSPAVEAVLQRALAPAIRDRYPSMEDLLEALEAAAVETPRGAAGDSELAPIQIEEPILLPGLESELQVGLVDHAGELGLTWTLASSDPARATAFQDALLQAQRVERPNLAPLVSFGPRGPHQLLAVSAWGRGPTARDLIAEGPLSEGELVRLTLPVLEGLSGAHSSGVTHGLIDPRLLETGPVPRLHGLGVVPAARGIATLPAVDVRDFALLLLQLLAGALLEEQGLEAVRLRGLEGSSGALREALERATSAEPYLNAQGLLDAIEQDPRVEAWCAPPPPEAQPLPMGPALLAGLFVLLLVGVLIFGPSASDTPSPTPSRALAQATRSQAPTPTQSPQPSQAPSALTPTPAPSPTPGPTLQGPPWFAELPLDARPPLPLPAGVSFGEAADYLLAKDGSILVWVPEAAVFLGKHEVTWQQIRSFARATQRPFKPPGFAADSDHPAHFVSWEDATSYATWAGARLPSGDEWELAAGGERYPWGDATPTPAHANLCGTEDGHAWTSPVGSFPRGASPAGCLDMAGNVAEWVSDTYGAGERGVRGGAWFSLAWDSRVQWQGHADPKRQLDFVGFRLAVPAR